jgi:hypothetical protein
MGHRIQQDTVNTAKEVEIPIPWVSRERRHAMAIKAVYWDGDDVQLVPGSYASVTAHLAREPMSTYGAYPEGAGNHNRSVISCWSRFLAMRYMGTAEYGLEYETDERWIVFPMPYIVLEDTLYLRVTSIGIPGAAVKTIDVSIFYEIIELTDDDWIELSEHYESWRFAGKN